MQISKCQINIKQLRNFDLIQCSNIESMLNSLIIKLTASDININIQILKYQINIKQFRNSDLIQCSNIESMLNSLTIKLTTPDLNMNIINIKCKHKYYKI